VPSLGSHYDKGTGDGQNNGNKVLNILEWNNVPLLMKNNLELLERWWRRESASHPTLQNWPMIFKSGDCAGQGRC